MFCSSKSILVSPEQLGYFQLILVDRGRREKDQSRFLCHDAWMVEDVSQIFLVFVEWYMLTCRASWQTSVIGAEEDGLDDDNEMRC